MASVKDSKGHEKLCEKVGEPQLQSGLWNAPLRLDCHGELSSERISPMKTSLDLIFYQRLTCYTRPHIEVNPICLVLFFFLNV